MDSTKDFNENCGLHVDDAKQCETTELKQENQSSHVTLRKKEAAEGDENGLESGRETDPEALESVQKYASRIKSFLGWEPIVDEQKIEKESGESTTKAVGASKVQEEENDSVGDTVNKEDSRSLEDEENEESIAQPQESEQVIEAKPDTGLQSDQPNECLLVNTSPKPEAGETENEEISPEVEDADDSSNLFNNIPDVNAKELTSDSQAAENKSESDVNQTDCTSPEMDQNELPNSKNSSSSRTVSEDAATEVPLKESKASDIVVEKTGVIDEEKKEQKLIPELEADVSKDLLEEDNLNSLSELTVSPTTADESENKNNDSCKNLNETDERDDSTHFQENVPLENIKKPYMEEIRRLSIDIVKDVIESARNSVHEIIVSKSIQEMRDENVNENHNGGDASCAFNGSKILEAENLEDKHTLTDSATKEVNTLEKMYNELTESKYNMNLTKEGKESVTDEETVCGFGSFKPQWIQKYATAKIFLCIFSLIGVINGTYYSYVVSILSTLEKRYAFRTKVSGTILLADEITPLVLGVIVGYIGGKTHRPRMVALGMFMQVVCCFISGLPFLIYGSSKQILHLGVGNGTDPEVCEARIRKETCDLDDRPPTLTVVGIFLLASIFRGFATLSFYVIGISYMDDITKKKNTPVYLAISLALRLLGPLFGFLMSSAFLKLYENPFDDPGYGPDDPRWIGAWWMGFFLQGVLLLIFTLPIALFPRRLPGQKKLEKFPTASKEESWRDTLQGLVSALKRLGKNPIFIVLIINTTMKIFGHFGHAIMLPKYMENQFRLSAADASLFSGAASIFCMMISTVLGGFIIWKFRPRIKLLLAGLVTSEIILCTGFLILMIPRCQPAHMLHYGMDDKGLILDSVCNQNCDCSTKSFTPFCGPDGETTYFSPCHAGCTQDLKLVNSSQQEMAFGDCSCVNSTDSDDPSSGMITKGFCPDENCWSKALAYLIIFLTLDTLSNTLTVAHTMILLRSVHPSDKSVALGTFETFICLFGFIPFPVTFGALVDSACLVWEESCGETGNCWFYDIEKYSYLLHGVSAIFCSLSTICLITLYFLSSRVRNLYKEEDEEEYIDNIKLDTVSGSVTKL